MEAGTEQTGQLRCPVCGVGTLRDLAYDEGTPARNLPEQRADTREVQLFTCGHEVEGPRLDSADQDRLDVERRRSEETVDPAPS